MGGSWGHDVAGGIGGQESIGVGMTRVGMTRVGRARVGMTRVGMTRVGRARVGRARVARAMALAAMLLAVPLCSVLAQPAGAAAVVNRFGYSLTPSRTTPFTPCPSGGRMLVECNIVIDPHPVKLSSGRYRPPAGGPLFEGGGELGGYDPKDLQSAYGIPTTGGTGETVAVVEAWGYAAAESDLAKYREKYGLAACTKANGCFKKVNEKGEEANYPKEGGEAEKSWSVESALDVDMVSAACASCHILVVERAAKRRKILRRRPKRRRNSKRRRSATATATPRTTKQRVLKKKGAKNILPSTNTPASR
jgi:hypothetical protein